MKELIILIAVISSAAGAKLTQSASGNRREPDLQCRQVYRPFEVDTSAQTTRAITPEYPDRMKVDEIGGEVQVQFVVDTLGSVDSTSIRILSSAHELFSASVRSAVLKSRFTAAKVKSRKVCQLVIMKFLFRPAT